MNRTHCSNPPEAMPETWNEDTSDARKAVMAVGLNAPNIVSGEQVVENEE